MILQYSNHQQQQTFLWKIDLRLIGYNQAASDLSHDEWTRSGRPSSFASLHPHNGFAAATTEIATALEG